LIIEHDLRNVLPDFNVVPVATGAVPNLSRAQPFQAAASRGPRPFVWINFGLRDNQNKKLAWAQDLPQHMPHVHGMFVGQVSTCLGSFTLRLRLKVQQNQG
jgi:hypothetical protein